MKLADLHVGDIIRNRYSGAAYTVIRTDPAIIAVRDVQVDNPSEWTVVARSEMVEGDYDGQWFAGWVTCIACGQTHMSVHPAVCERVECPHCGFMTDAPEVPR